MTRKRPNHRWPVRDPLAGILSDWFGVENGSAKVLLVLFRATVPLTGEQLAARADIGVNGVKACLVRLRSSGINIPRMDRWHRTYIIDGPARNEVQRAFDYAAKLASEPEAEIERLRTKVQVLEDALGLVGAEPPEDCRLTRLEAALYGLLCKAPVLSKERAWTALYGHLLDAPEPKVLDVMVCHMRPKLARHGMRIETVWGVGYRLVNEAREAA